MNSLKKKSAIALAWDFGGLLIQRGSGFVISIFLARLLSPADFGLVGMAMVFIGISQGFIDVGFSSALIQRNENSNLAYSSVFYFNLAVGLALTALFYFLAPAIASFFENSEITSLVRWISLSFLFNSLNQVQLAILKKRLNFKALSIRVISASIFGGILGIVAAFYGFGSHALVVQTLSSAVLSTILLWSISSWKPNLQFSVTELKKLLGFSSYVFFDGVSSSIFKKLDVFFIGKAFSPATLGLYTRADSLNIQVTAMTSSSIKKVFFPVLSKLKDDDQEFKRVYYVVVSLICFLSFLLSGVLYALAEPIIIGLFGEKWVFSIVIFQILIFKSFNVPLNGMMLNALISKGKSKENFQIGIVRKCIRALPILVGLQYGLIAFVWSVTGVSYLLTFYNIYFLKKYLGVEILYHVRKIFEGIIPFLLFVLFLHLNDNNSWYFLFAATLLYCIFYVLYAYVIRMDGYLFFIKELKKILKRKL